MYKVAIASLEVMYTVAAYVAPRTLDLHTWTFERE